MPNLYVALVHHPVVNKNGEVIAAAVTNLDLHDIARAAKTYDIKGFYVTTPLADQQLLVQRITAHWLEGAGGRYNPKRREALALIRLADCLEQALAEIGREEGERPQTVATAARRRPGSIGFRRIAQTTGGREPPCSGAGYGLGAGAIRVRSGRLGAGAGARAKPLQSPSGSVGGGDYHGPPAGLPGRGGFGERLTDDPDLGLTRSDEIIWETTMEIIKQLEREMMRLDLPAFAAGDTVKVHVKIKEGEKERIQVFQGVVISKRKGAGNASFTVRKVSYGIGVERVFPLHSPIIDKVEVVTRGRVRRAKIYYLRNLRGKAARIRERRLN